MRRVMFLSALALVAQAATVAAQKPAPAKHAEFAGNWAVKAMVGPKDSVVVTYVLHATSTEQGWTIRFPKRTAIPVRIVTMGGDSVVADAGPYASVLRASVTVTTRTITHIKGNTLSGTASAKYANGDVLALKISGTREK